MGIPSDLLAQIRHMIRPVSTRVANMVARAVVQLADDGRKLQMLQVGALADEDIPDAEHHQPYGFSSIPLEGAEAVLVFPNGDRSHPLVVAVSDRRHRPTGGVAGEVTMYHHAGARVIMKDNGDITVVPGAGGKVKIDDGSGATAIPTMADFAGIISIMSSCGAGSSTAVPATLSAYQSSHPTWPVGTTILKAK